MSDPQRTRADPSMNNRRDVQRIHRYSTIGCSGHSAQAAHRPIGASQDQHALPQRTAPAPTIPASPLALLCAPPSPSGNAPYRRVEDPYRRERFQTFAQLYGHLPSEEFEYDDSLQITVDHDRVIEFWERVEDGDVISDDVVKKVLSKQHDRFRGSACVVSNFRGSVSAVIDTSHRGLACSQGIHTVPAQTFRKLRHHNIATGHLREKRAAVAQRLICGEKSEGTVKTLEHLSFKTRSLPYISPPILTKSKQLSRNAV
ncbi:hypothetical protein QFC21_006125 [Naganishia friedmannii]|uniref:Uncharacterized protein n=1 Tax=Naganishia friedmannii TaxID=89922 RepID=A0ACC2V4N5_9TREE|nr:hypothetical protein QFC21_006125 [Naganishia friedmannii]